VKNGKFRRGKLVLMVAVIMAWLSTASVSAQPAPQIVKRIDESTRVVLTGNLHPLAKAENDLGTVDASQPAGRLLLVLKRTAKSEDALKQFLTNVHTHGSPDFHKWLTPRQFGQQFGPADSDVHAVAGWLGSHGLSVTKIPVGKSAIEFTGTVGQVNAAFHTSIHTYKVNGELHHANATNPEIPAALSPVVAGVAALNDFHPKPMYRLLGTAAYSPKTHEATPQWTIPGQSGSLPFYLLTPEDFSTQYDVKPAYSAGVNGTGQTIGIINDSNIDVSLVNAYRTLFGLPANPPQVVVDGNDPGINYDATEAYLDVENAGAVAPNATVILYTAGTYGSLQNGGGINFSLVRAVEDDAASVLSLSFGNCEQNLTDAGNQLINELWEQAAAQGQTAFVSAGDTGSAGCDYNGSSAANFGLAVNGLASTPWNIAVGGTDFYYSDYATGGASIANYWNTTNDSEYGSLQKPVPEQTWNDSVYGFNIPGYDPIDYQQNTTGAGGGGVSSCAYSTTDSNGNVICNKNGGYSKPVWQVGSSVPQDGARDLPDVSLFSSNGANGAAWPICVQAGECVADSSGSVSISAVGGTSASAPAMAGIMALINQKYGAQGQANFVLYPLAAQFATSFNAVDVGSNNVPCYEGSPNCSLDSNGDGLYSLQEYPAGPGYDLASGLGTLDVNALLTNWNKISFNPTTTTLTLTPATITHGQNITAAVNVTSTVPGTPTGSVTLVTTSTLPANQGQTTSLVLNDGSATQAINFLPGGTYNVSGKYSGDGIFGASTSSPVPVTVSAEASNINLQAYDNSGPYNSFIPLTNGAQVPFGTQILVDIQPTGVSAPAGQTNGTATGTATYTDGSTTLATASLSSLGTAEYSTQTLAMGSHSLGVKYSGDASFQSSTGGPISFSIVKSYSFTFFEYPVYFNGQIPAGQNAVFTVAVGGGSFGPVPPTGTVAFQLNSNTPVTVNLANWNAMGLASTTLSGLPVGSYTLNATYSGDANYTGSAPSSPQSFTVVAPSLLPSITSLAITSPSDPSTITPTTMVTLTATVQGGTGATSAPTGNIVFADGYFGTTTTPFALTPGTGASSTATWTFQPLSALPFIDTNELSAVYSGDALYNASFSTPVGVPSSAADFSITSQASNVAIKSGSTGTATINLAPVDNFSGTLTLACTAPAAITCSLNPASATLSAATTATLTINAFTITQSTAALSPQQHGLFLATSGFMVAGFVLLGFGSPNRRRRGQALLGLVVFAILSIGVGCGGSTSNVKKTTQINAPAGTYRVSVSATSSSGEIHNTLITVFVQ